jgi:hypothetical protein
MRGMKPMLAALFVLLLAPLSLAQPCPCDCNGDSVVRVNELTTGVNIGLERLDMDSCPAADADGSDSVEVSELVAGVGAALGGCPAAQPTPTPVANLTAAELVAARARWREQGLFHYQYRYGLGCFCHGPHDVVLEVFDDRIAGFRDPGSGEPLPPPSFLDLYFTIDGLFAYLEASLDGADIVQVDFHPTLGYPAEVFIDHYREAVDDELWIDIRDVEPLQMAGVCRTANDCDVSFEICIEPGGFAGCGACLDHQPECESDGDCGDRICEPVGYSAATCACDPSILVCVDGCASDSDCPAGQNCGEDRHCAAIPCRISECGGAPCNDPCPDLFTCSAVIPLSGECRRTSCSSDTDCSDRTGFCVNGECHPGPGSCDIVPP